MHDCEVPVKPRTIVYQAPDPIELQHARERRIRELKMYDILREIFLYVIYVWIIIVISYEFRDPRSFQFRENLRRAFVTGGRSTAISSQTSLELVSELYRRRRSRASLVLTAIGLAYGNPVYLTPPQNRRPLTDR